MEDAERVTVLDGVEQLEEDRRDEAVVADVRLVRTGDHGKEVAVGAVVENLKASARTKRSSVYARSFELKETRRETHDVDDGGRLDDAVD